MRDADWMRGAEAAELTIDDGGKRKEGRKEGRKEERAEGEATLRRLENNLERIVATRRGGGCADYTTVGGGAVWGDGMLRGNMIYARLNQDSIQEHANYSLL